MSISEKVVLKVSDLMTWMVDDVKWEVGARGVYDERWQPADDAADAADARDAGATRDWYGPIDMRDVAKEKQLLSKFPFAIQFIVNQVNSFRWVDWAGDKGRVLC